MLPQLLLHIIIIIEFFLVYWPEEKTVSVVPRGKVTEGHTVNDKCCVKIGRQRHQGEMVAIGKNIFLHK